jgi:phage terminase large subunit
MDYGLDTCAVYEVAVDQSKRLYVYKEFYRPDLPIPEAAKQILAWQTTGVKFSYTVASPDLWNRRQDTGIAGEELFRRYGLHGLTKADDRRVPGWQALHSYLLPQPDEQGGKTPWLYVFSNCTNLIRTLPALVRDDRNPDDVSDACEDHGPEALRYGVMSRPPRAITTDEAKRRKRRRQQMTAPGISDITGY